MTTITLNTRINAPIGRVFDLARSIDFHKISMQTTNEEAIAGRMKGLIEFGETVMWKAKHFGFYQKLTVEIIEFKSPEMFEDVMVKGAFKRMKHLHHFKLEDGETNMSDEFEFESPFGILGRLVDRFVLKRYLMNLLLRRNKELKSVAEGSEWRIILK
jgi:ligand-binding SRPBCC domain-containing protein